ncbi:MAG: hypothetical protein NTU44_18040 [Bacteroidetes bacterium]|nr:hypothetical protein [Bacteroidota bacterium]
MKKTFLLLSLFLISGFGICQNLQFYREDLTFEIKDSSFYVGGTYHFCNNGESEIKQILFYPFPSDSLYGGVDSIRAMDLNTESLNIITSKTDKGFFFKITLKPYGTGKYKISYRQKLLKNKAEYILITTQKWGNPFESSDYRLITPLSMKISSSSYPPDNTIQTTDHRIYSWSRKDFMPDKNMIFFFEK